MKFFRKILPFLVGAGVFLASIAYGSAFLPFQGGTGTGVTPASGTVLIGNGTGTYTPAFLLCSGGCTITNASGSVTVNQAAGVATSVINGVNGPTFTISFVTTSSDYSITTSSVNLFLNILASSTWLKSANNLSDLISTSSARTNIGYSGLSPISISSTGTIIFTNPGYLLNSNNLSELTNTSTARTNLGLGSAATQNSSAFFQVANNLSESTNTSTLRTNIGIYSANNTWSGTQTFNNSTNFAATSTFNSSTIFNAPSTFSSTSTFASSVIISTVTSSILATDSTGKIVATTTSATGGTIMNAYALQAITAGNAVIPSADWTNMIQATSTTQEGMGVVTQGGGQAQKGAHSFNLAATSTLSQMTFVCARSGTPVDNILVSVQADSAGSPSGTPLASTTIAAATCSQTNPAHSNITASFNATMSASASTTYWLTFERSGSLSDANYYILWGTSTSSDVSYTRGTYKEYNGTNWTTVAPGNVAHFSLNLDYFTVALASASTSTTANPFLGFANATVGNNGSLGVTIAGLATVSGLVVGQQYYLANASGTVSSTVGTITRKVGIGVATSTMLISNIW